jgi:multisubunit Na+/H+ antiporter MnhG subunit
MTREIITDVLLALAVATVAAAALGVAVMPGAAARLHYVTPAAVVAPVLVLLAVFVTEGLDENTGETLLAVLIMIATAPYLSHATIRAIRASDATAPGKAASECRGAATSELRSDDRGTRAGDTA